MKLKLPSLENNIPFVPWTEHAETSHIQFLAEFNQKVWPSLKHLGFSKETLLLYWMFNVLDGRLQDSRTVLQEEETI